MPRYRLASCRGRRARLLSGHHHRNKRLRRLGGGTYDGVTGRAIFERDGWKCQMPVCHCRQGRDLDRALLGAAGPGAPTVDHIIRLSDGGADNAANKRAAHFYCNQQAAITQDQALTATITGYGKPPAGLACWQERNDPARRR